MLIETLSYKIYEAHGRFMVEKFINGHYDCFTRVRLDTMNSIFGEHPSPYATPTWELEATPAEAPGSWTLTTHPGYGDEPRTQSVTAEQVRELLEETPAVSMGYTYPGDNVEVNYTYREAQAGGGGRHE